MTERVSSDKLRSTAAPRSETAENPKKPASTRETTDVSSGRVTTAADRDHGGRSDNRTPPSTASDSQDASRNRSIPLEPPGRPDARYYDKTVKNFARVAATCAAVAIAIAVASLIVRVTDPDSIVTNQSRLWIMHANTALAMLFSALALLLTGMQDERLREPGFFRSRTRIDLLIGALGAIAATIGAATLLEYATGTSLGIDDVLAAPGASDGNVELIRRPSVISALMMTSIGTMIALSAWYGERLWRGVQATAACTLLLSLLILVADLYDAESIRNLTTPLGTTATAAVGFGMISIAALFVRPLFGWMQLVSGAGSGSDAARRILPVVLFGIPTIGYVRLLAQNSGLVGNELGLTLFAGAAIAATSSIVLWSASRVNQQEDRRIISEAERDRSRALIDGLVANSDAVISVQDPEGRYALINDAFERQYGVDREHAIGSRSYDVLEPERAFRLEGLRNDVLARRNPTVQELQAEDGDREETFLTQLFPIVDDDGNLIGSGSIGTDISESKRAERLMQKLNEDLRRETDRSHQAIEELESFAHTVSHDLRSPLRAIDGFARIVVEDCKDTLEDRDRRYLNLVLQGAAEMGSMIDDLLEFSRVGRTELNLTRLDMTKIVKDVNDHLEHEREGRDVRVTINELPPAIGDQRFIFAVFQNLLTNAFKYSRKREVAEIEIGALAAEDGAPVTYYVRDNGVGFDMQYADKLFAPFERLHRAEDYEGSGVGLATVQRVLRRHGGTIWAESEVDVGTTMFFQID